MPSSHETPADRPANRLAAASSPYLLQHAHNPVDWYVWGDEAFERARREDKPIFLSIGYSTCHWCHVMAHESFEDEGIAAYLNEHFVCVKVDREERPDVDAIYMRAVQALSGRGGWPLSVWLTPELEPFFGGTYFPPEDRHGRAGFPTVLARIVELWATQRAELEAQGARLTEHVRAQNEAAVAEELGPELLDLAVTQFARAFDAQEGGFGPAPKFPRAFSLSFLLRQASRGRADQILPMVRATLDAMRLGGIHDHLGGGFHRYSTDREWLLPHFEKMLYDQALLGRAYVEAWQVTGDAAYADTARGVCDYVLRDLRDERGGFHSAEDADSEGEEGVFYIWTPEQVREVLGDADGALLSEVYGVVPGGNFRDESTGRRPGPSILHLERPLPAIAAERGEDPDAFAARMAGLRARLLDARGERIRPHLDDKVLTDWNGLMIGTLAHAGAALGEPRYVAAAREAAAFVLGTLRTEDGLLHRYRAGEAGIPAFLDDHAYLAHGLLELHQATQETRWLAAALEIAREMRERFEEADGTFVLAARAAPDLVAPTKELYDGALPSGNSVAAHVLLRLGRLTGDGALEAAGRRTLAAWSGTIARYPMGYPFSLLALDLDVGPAREIVIAGDPADPRTAALLETARARFVARDLILVHDPGDAGSALRALAPYVAAQGPVDGRPAAYVCTDRTCDAPVTESGPLRALLR